MLLTFYADTYYRQLAMEAGADCFFLEKWRFWKYI